MMLQSVAALAVVLALFAGLVWGLRRLQFRHLPQGESAMRIVQRLAIDTRHSVVEIEHHGRRYLLGVSPNGMSSLSSHGESTDLINRAADSHHPDEEGAHAEGR